MANTTNRSYPKPVNSNLVSEDVNLLKQAFDMIDVDVANLLLALAGKAAAAASIASDRGTPCLTPRRS